jgi:single-stranded-DNA-specific exonuclease
MKRVRLWSYRSVDPAVERALASGLSLSPLAARVLALRGVTSADHGRSFLDASLQGLTAPAELPQMAQAVERLVRALAAGEKILVFGDSDVDGLSGSCLLGRMLAALGGDVAVHVPERTTDGYGLSAGGVAAVRRHQPRVLVTVDHGVTAHAAVGELMREGIDVVVTDHHQKPAQLPPALAVVNPLFLDEGHAAAKLSGAGVAFQLACGIFETLPAAQKQDPRLRQVLREGLALAALGTVADVVALVGENRLLVRHGLKQLESTGLPGLQALRQAAQLDDKKLEAEDISFGFAPRLNAAGRLGRVDVARRLLMTDDAGEARRLANELESMNQQRRTIEARVFECAKLRLAASPDDAPLVVLGDDDFHAGVIGIVAAKLVGLTGKPVLLISTGAKVARGSGRSVPGFDLARALSRASDLLQSCGGHAAAAGLEMDPTRVGELTERLAKNAAEDYREPAPPTLQIDSEVLLHEMHPRLLDELRRLGPWGEGNPKPVFAATDVELAAPPRRVGKDGGHLQLRLKSGGKSLPAIAFGFGPQAESLSGGRLSLAFTPRPSTYAGPAVVELVVADVRAATAAVAET